MYNARKTSLAKKPTPAPVDGRLKALADKIKSNKSKTIEHDENTPGPGNYNPDLYSIKNK